MGTNSYFLKAIPSDVWQAVKVKAATRKETIRQVLLRALTRYAKGK